MLDAVRRHVNEPGHEHNAVREGNLFEDLPFVLVAWVRSLDVDGPDVRPEDRLDDLAQRHVVVVRPRVVSPADVEAQLLARDPFDRPVQRLDRLVEVRPPVGDVGADRPEVLRHREVGRVELELEPRLRDRAVLVAHRFRDRVEVRLVRGVVPVRVVERDLPRRGGGEERVAARMVAEGRAERLDVGVDGVGVAHLHRPLAAQHQDMRADLVREQALRDAGELKEIVALDPNAAAEARQPIEDVVAKPDLAHLAVADDVDPDRPLPVDDLPNRRADSRR